MDFSNSNFTITNPGAAFQFTTTYQGPGITNQTVIQRTTEVTSVTDTTSIFTIAALTIASPVNAADVGGVSATANPIANSSGSVTNQAIQVLQGPYITNTYGGGISCQGPTANFTPYITHARNDKDPFETFIWNLSMTTETLKED